MTMKRIYSESESGSKDRFFPMKDMNSGQICCVRETEQYVLCIWHPPQEIVYLILSDQTTVNSYGHRCSKDVRPLRDGEEVIIKFT